MVHAGRCTRASCIGSLLTTPLLRQALALYISNRTVGSGAAALGPAGARTGTPAGFDDRELAGRDGARGGGTASRAELDSSLRMAQPL
jgi:hypothetical protein